MTKERLIWSMLFISYVLFLKKNIVLLVFLKKRFNLLALDVIGLKPVIAERNINVSIIGYTVVWKK